MRYLGLPLIVAVLLTMTACSSKSSSNSDDQSNSAASSAEPSASAATTSASATGDIPSYPGAVTQASGTSSNSGQSASGSVLITDDGFDKVYTWYQKNMPAGSEKSHVTTPIESAVFMIGDPTTGQKSVTITGQGDKTMISIANVKS